MSRDHKRSIRSKQLIDGEVSNVEMAVARSKIKPLGKRVVWIATIADNEVAVATVHHHRIEAQNTPVARSTNRFLFNRAATFGEKAVDNLHL